VAKVSMNKLKAIHNLVEVSNDVQAAVAKVSMNKLKAIHNPGFQIHQNRVLWQKYQ